LPSAGGSVQPARKGLPPPTSTPCLAHYESLAACCLAEVGEGLRTIDSAQPCTSFASAETWTLPTPPLDAPAGRSAIPRGPRPCS
jgi:hypothetical protein